MVAAALKNKTGNCGFKKNKCFIQLSKNFAWLCHHKNKVYCSCSFCSREMIDTLPAFVKTLMLVLFLFFRS